MKFEMFVCGFIIIPPSSILVHKKKDIFGLAGLDMSADEQTCILQNSLVFAFKIPSFYTHI